MKPSIYKQLTKRTALFMSVLVTSLSTLGTSTVYAAGSASFTAEPVSTSINVGAGTEINLYVTPSGANLLTGTLRVNFPSNLQYQSFNSGGTPFNVSTTTGAPGVGASNVQIIMSYFPPGSGAAGSKLFIGKVAVNGLSAGAGAVTLSNLAANEPDGSDMTATGQNTSITVNSVGQPPTDTDGDGILDSSDACPTEAEDKDGKDDGDGCPEQESTTPPPTSTTTTTTKPASSKVTVPNKTEPTKSEVVPVEEIIQPRQATVTKPRQATVTTKSASSNIPKLVVMALAGAGLLAALVVILRRQMMWGGASNWKNKFVNPDYYKSSPDDTKPDAAASTKQDPTPKSGATSDDMLDKIQGPKIEKQGEVVPPKPTDNEPKL